MIGEPPSEMMLPPAIALLAVMFVADVVVSVGIVGGLPCLRQAVNAKNRKAKKANKGFAIMLGCQSYVAVTAVVLLSLTH